MKLLLSSLANSCGRGKTHDNRKIIWHCSKAGETDAGAYTAEESSTYAELRAAAVSAAAEASSSTMYDPSACDDAWGSEMDKLGG